jgi:hypothetical protein
MAPHARPLSTLDELVSAGRLPPPPHSDLATSLVLLDEMADMLDSLGSPEMARALRQEAAAVFGPVSGLHGLPAGAIT